MKFLTTVAIATSLVMAAPAPEAEAGVNEARSWCTLPGQGCWKAKREAEAEAAVAEERSWCTLPGQGCWKAKRQADAAAHDERSWCTLPGQGCWKVKRAVDAFTAGVQSHGLPATGSAGGVQVGDLASFNALASYLAGASGDHKAFVDAVGELNERSWCTLPGQGCWKAKRDAEASSNEARWCLLPGQGCWKAKRDVAVPAEGLTLEKAWCSRVPEAACHAVKSVSRSVLEAVGKQEEEDTIEQRSWCTLPGQGCWKAKRDVAAIREMARHVLDNLE